MQLLRGFIGRVQSSLDIEIGCRLQMEVQYLQRSVGPAASLIRQMANQAICRSLGCPEEEVHDGGGRGERPKESQRSGEQLARRHADFLMEVV